MMISSYRCRGFSLVELMCSMVIGSILLLVAAFMLGSAGDGYQRVVGGVATEREARALISQLTADLSTARFHKDGLLGKSPALRPNERLGFLCLQPVHGQSEAESIGDLCAVYYYIKDISIGGKTVRCLMRACRESKETFKALEDGEVASLFAERVHSDEPVAFGVISFAARPKSRDRSGRWIDWVQNDHVGPEAIDLRLVIARRELAGKLKRPGDWDGVGATAGMLGMPAELGRNTNLEVYETMMRVGNHESR